MKRKLVVSLCVFSMCLALAVPKMVAEAETNVVYEQDSRASAKVVHSGVCGDLKWSIKDNGEFLLEGSGSLAKSDFGSFVIDKDGKEFFMASNEIAWKSYKNEIKHAKIRVKNATSLASILSDCPNLETVDFTGSDTSKTLDFAGMFATEYLWGSPSNKLKSVDLSMLDTSSAIRMSQLFWGCINLETVNISGWKTPNLTDMTSMFDSCNSLKKITGIESLDTSNVTNMFAVFQLCKSLKELDLSRWDTHNVTELNSAFNGCGNLEKLNVSTWDVSQVTNFYRLFDSDAKLKELNLTKWNMKSAKEIDFMFGSCYELSGGITFNSNIASYEDAFYAAACNSTNPFVIGYTDICGEALINQIYHTNGGFDTKLVLKHKTFADVTDDAWYKNYVMYVYDKGLMSGSQCLFRPTENVTRAQLVTTIYRLAGSPKVTDYSACHELSDIKTGKYYTDAVCWAYNNGVTTGNAGKFDIEGNLTRQQMAAFFYRFAEVMGYDIDAAVDYSEMLNADKVSEYAQNAVSWAVGSGLISGSAKQVNGITVYDLNPRGNTTRGQLSAIIQRFCEKNQI